MIEGQNLVGENVVGKVFQWFIYIVRKNIVRQDVKEKKVLSGTKAYVHLPLYLIDVKLESCKCICNLGIGKSIA